jgi:hypothetical protein
MSFIISASRESRVYKPLNHQSLLKIITMKQKTLLKTVQIVILVTLSSFSIKKTSHHLYCTAPTVIQSIVPGICQYSVPQQFLSPEPDGSEPIGTFACIEGAPGICPLVDIYPSN